MNISNQELRFYVFARAKLGDNAASIHQQLSQILPETCSLPSYRSVARWCQEFGEGRTNFGDAQRSGAPCAVRTAEAVAKVAELIEADKRLTVRMIEEQTSIPKTTVHRILTDDLHRKKICARWVPHLLSPEEKQRRVTCAEEILGLLQSNRRMKILTGDESWFWLNQQQNKRQNMVWLAGDEERPDVLRQSFRSKKFMFTVFISNEKVEFVDMLPEKK